MAWRGPACVLFLMLSSTAAAAQEKGLPLPAPEAPAPAVDPATVPALEPLPDLASVPDDATLEASGAVIGAIRLRIGNIFDPTLPGEDNTIFQAANYVHIRTREPVIRRRLLFKEGEVYSRRLLEESERLLRSLGFLYDAKVRPVAYDGERVDVEVETRDVWTLRAGVNFGRKGGENHTRFGVEEKNFLGFGKHLSVQRSRDVDRVSQLYGYVDPALAGSRMRMELAYLDNSDGYQQSATLERPFYSLDTTWAAGISFDRNDRVDPLYELGQVTSRFRHESRTASAFAGFSRGLKEGRARRLSAGFTFDRHTFEPVPDQTPPSPFPIGRMIAYPWIAFDSVQDGFITVHDLDKIKRTEDLNLAHEGHARLGWGAPAFGSDRGRLLFDAFYRAGLQPGPGRMILMSAETSGRRSSRGFENTLAGGGVRFFLRDLGRHLFYVSLRTDAAYRLDRESQLLLGGDSGLRGYPLRYQDGDRRVLVTLEQRFYTDWHVFKLFRVGGAVFFDAGRAWFVSAPAPAGRPDLGLLKDAGFGLRLASSRSSTAAMAHLDFAWALDGDPSIRRFQIFISTRETF